MGSVGGGSGVKFTTTKRYVKRSLPPWPLGLSGFWFGARFSWHSAVAVLPQCMALCVAVLPRCYAPAFVQLVVGWYHYTMHRSGVSSPFWLLLLHCRKEGEDYTSIPLRRFSVFWGREFVRVLFRGGQVILEPIGPFSSHIAPPRSGLKFAMRVGGQPLSARLM